MRRLWIAVLLAGVLCAGAFAGEEPTQDDPLVRATARLTTAPVDDVLRAMMSGDPLERRAAAIVAARRTEESPALLDELVSATGDDAASVRLAATRALGATGRIAATSVERLSRLAEHATDAVQRRAAAAALVRISIELDASRRLLVDPSGRALVFAGLTDLGAEGVLPLVALSRSEDWRTRAAAARALGAADGTSVDVRGALDELLRDDSGAVRVAALTALPTVLGSGLLTTTHVERAFSGEGSERERLLTIVALAEPGCPGGATDDGAREAALRFAVAGGERGPLLGAVRMAHASGLRTDAALVTLAGIANGADVQIRREAALVIRHAANEAPLSMATATAVRMLVLHEDPHVSADAAAAVVAGGHGDATLAGPMCRALVSRSWGGWSSKPMRTVPFHTGRRNLRAGGGRGPSDVLSPPPSMHHDDLAPLLRAHVAAATTALEGLLAHELSATRSNAAWMLAEVRRDDDACGEALLPLLDDPVLSVRIVASVLCARTDAHEADGVRAAVRVLLGEGVERYDDTVIFWDDEMIEALTFSPDAAVDELVACWARFIALRRDRELETYETPPGYGRVPEILAALGDSAVLRVVDALVAGDPKWPDRRSAAFEVLSTLPALGPAARERLESFCEETTEVGAHARTLLGRRTR